MRRRYMYEYSNISDNMIVVFNLPSASGGVTEEIFTAIKGWDKGYATYVNPKDIFNDQSFEFIYSYTNEIPSSIRISDDVNKLKLIVDYNVNKGQIYVYKIKWSKGYFFLCLKSKGIESKKLYPILSDLGYSNVLNINGVCTPYITAYYPD